MFASSYQPSLSEALAHPIVLTTKSDVNRPVAGGLSQTELLSMWKRHQDLLRAITRSATATSSQTTESIQKQQLMETDVPRSNVNILPQTKTLACSHR
uniref:Uncharacterized protein n=1 Tax=Ditylenchus dipsaci TaxID=166011 RepID=A0A915CYY5_9BILA